VLYKLTYLLSYLLLRKIYSPKNLIVNTCIVVRSLKNTTFQHFFCTQCAHICTNQHYCIQFSCLFKTYSMFGNA